MVALKGTSLVNLKSYIGHSVGIISSPVAEIIAIIVSLPRLGAIVDFILHFWFICVVMRAANVSRR